MTNQELISMLLAHEPTAQVMLMTQRKQPFENYVAGVAARSEMVDQAFRNEPGISSTDLFIVVGRRIRPGSLSAWTLAENRQAMSFSDSQPRENAVGAIARHLFAGAVDAESGRVIWHAAGLMQALHAAYDAGYANAHAADGVGEDEEEICGVGDVTREVDVRQLAEMSEE